MPGHCCAVLIGLPTYVVVIRIILANCQNARDASGQSYKKFKLVIYESRVVIWDIFKSGTTLES